MLNKRLSALVMVLFAQSILQACVGKTLTAEHAEILNIRPSYIVPKTPPNKLVRTIKRYCFTDDAAMTRSRLIKDDYVSAASFGFPNGFVVDNNSPLVVVNKSGCAVRASARTGQSNAIAEFFQSQTGIVEAPSLLAQIPRSEQAYFITQPFVGHAVVMRERRSSLVTELSVIITYRSGQR